MKSSAKPEPEVRAPAGESESSASASPGMSTDPQVSMTQAGDAHVNGSEPPANDSPKAPTPASAPEPPAPTAAPASSAGMDSGTDKGKKSKSRARSRAGLEPNNVRKLRQEAMMSKAELARRAGVSPLTIDRVEAGCPCRMDTKRKILEALGLKPSARAEVWPSIDDQG